LNPVITETPLHYGAHSAADHAVPDRVLMFAYIFPPLAGGGVQRTLKYVKYLPLHGFSSVVVTSRPRSIPVARDGRMLAEIPPGTVVVRARTVPIHRVQYKFDGALRRLGLPTAVARASMWPDEWVGWLPAAVWHGIRAVNKHRPRVIFSTSPMVTAHLAALIVHRVTGVPWVADFRDGWALDPGPAWSSVAPPRQVMEGFERLFVADAVRTTVACDSIDVVDLHRGDPRRVLIPNGVDLADLGDGAKAAVHPPEELFRLSYVGALYGSRNAAPVFAAANRLISRGILDPERLEIRVVGTATAVAEAEALPVSFTGFVEHTEAVREMRSASALIFHQPAEQMGVSGKIFEYLVSGRPILCVAHPDNVAYRLVQELGAGECADVRDPASVEAALERLVEKWKSGTLTLPDEVRQEALRRFSRDKLAGDLARLFRTVSAPVAAGSARTRA
jgi:glycosyltransferase involved in cell wall biosynthesis